MLFDFLAKLIDVYSRQLHEQQRRGRQVWDAKVWHEAQAKSLQKAVADANRLASERGDWIAKLEEGKAYLEKSNREQADWIARLEEAKVYLAAQVESLQQRLDERSKQGAELAAYLDKMRKSWWWRLGLSTGLLRRRPGNVK